ncbi:hypothetical protein H0H93_010668 [Arthromyces matolae]|nr:hypothetical protein H0H93_010668 [Arthromyces matolae]
MSILKDSFMEICVQDRQDGLLRSSSTPKPLISLRFEKLALLISMHLPMSASRYAGVLFAFKLIVKPPKIYTGRLPFVDIANDAEVIYRVIQGVRPNRPIIPDNLGVYISDDLWDLIRHCWEQQPTSRPSIEDVVDTISDWHRAWDGKIVESVENSVAEWIFSNQGHYLCWIENSSNARTSYISRVIANLCAREGKLAASFFFGNNGSPTQFFPQIIEQLASQFPSCESFIRAALREDPSLLSPSSTDELQQLLLKTIIFPMMTLGDAMAPKVIVVDELDLCKASSESSWLSAEILVQAIVWLAESMHRNSVPLQILVTSQPDLHRNVKRTSHKFNPEARSLYLYPHGLLDSWTDPWDEIQRMAVPSALKERFVEISGSQASGSEVLHVAPERLLSHISDWLNDPGEQQCCWVRYPIRQFGKRSSIAQHFADECSTRGALAAAIVCSDGGINARSLLPSIAVQLGRSMPALKPAMRQIIEDSREVLLTTDDYTFGRKLIIEPFLMGDFQRIAPMTIVIDCIGWSGGDFLLDTLIWMENAFRSHAVPLQIFVTSEPNLYQQANLRHPLFLDTSLTLQDYLDHMATLDNVQSLVESHRCRLQLLQCATHIHLSEHPLLRECIQADEDAIAGVLEGVLNSESDTQYGLALRGDDAHSFLNLLQIVLSKGQLSQQVGLKARRLLIKLSERSEIIPASVLIRGLTLTDNQPVSGGGFADIYRAVYRGQEVALKHLRVRQDQDSQKMRRAFGREALVWQQLKHPNVLPFLGIDSEVFPASLCMVSPWMRHGTLLDLRATYGPTNINIEKRLLEVAEGLEYLHSEGVVHGDLRGANILADNDWHAVLSDFGLTVFGDATVATHSSNPHGAVRWMAPELLNPEIFDLERFIKTRGSDVSKLYTGHHPFVEAANDAAVIYRVMMGFRPSLRLALSGDQTDFVMPGHAAEIVEWCWKHELGDRPEIMDVVQIMKTWDSMMSD